MKIIGLTGGIGSGKSTVSKCFEELGIPVFYADTVAKNLYKSKEVVEAVKNILKVDKIVDDQGNLDRAMIARMIFNDNDKLIKVNELLHPLVKGEFYKWIALQQAPFCIREAAILIESGSYKDCDAIIVVVADLEHRIRRVMIRDGLEKKQVEDRISKQLSDEQRLTYADFIIDNNGTPDSLMNQVKKIYDQLS